MWGPLSFHIRPFMGLLNINAAQFSSPGPMGIECICNKSRYTSLLVLKHFFMVGFINFTTTSTYPLLWWLHDDDTP